MSSSPPVKKRRRRLWLLLPAALALLFLLNLLLQSLWAHRAPYFTPTYARADLAPVVAQAALSPEDYRLLFDQTGLAPAAIDRLLAQGDEGRARILDTQERFFAPQAPRCLTLLGGRFTCEDRLTDGEGNAVSGVSLAPLKAGDILVSFSTHTFGWRHGHAGLVTDPRQEVSLEAVMMFTDSAQSWAWHWTTYSNFMVLRVKNADDATREAVAQFALDHLDGIPYHLTSGIFGPKAPAPDSPALCAQCAYLPWYAWQAFGYDLDSDGGRIVTVLDLAQSPLVEIVQVYGMDPRLLTLS